MNRFFSILTLLFFSASAAVFTSCQSSTPSQVEDKTYDDFPGQLFEVMLPEETPAVSEPVETKTIIQEVTSTDGKPVSILKTHQIEVTKTLIKSAPVGGDTRYKIEITALEDLAAVRLTESIPQSLKFKSGTKGATPSGDDLIWTFTSMKRGQTKSIEIVLVPVTEGNHKICSTVSVEQNLCMELFSGQPKLAIELKGPKTVELGSVATWQVNVTNNGTATAKNVVVTETLPSAFEPTETLRKVIAAIEAGEEKTVKYSAKAVTQGNFESIASATYEGDPNAPVVAKAPVRVVRSGIRVRKTGPEEAYVFKPEVFKITIENTGDTDLKNVRITDILPEGSSVVDNGMGRVSNNAIGWMIPNLPVGSSQLITTEIAATRKGESVNTVRVITENGFEGSDSATTNWLAVPGVTVSITDSKDPIRIKERTTYNIQVNNQGKFEPVSGTVTVTFNNSIKPIAVTGDAQGNISGQTVTFPRTTLEPGKDIYLNIIAEGARVGAGRIVMNFSADFLVDPIISQETTNVY